MNNLHQKSYHFIYQSVINSIINILKKFKELKIKKIVT